MTMVNPLDKPEEKKEEKEPEEEKALGNKHKYGMNITHAFEADLADFVGTQVSMIRKILSAGKVTEKTMEMFLKAFPKYKK
jgi:hypothetical protein